MTDSQIIHEAMGLCWHEYNVNSNCCLKCKNVHLVRVGDSNKSGNPNYNDPAPYLEAIAYFRKKDKGKWWANFLSTIQRYGQKVCVGVNRFNWYIRDDFLDPSVGVPKLASHLKRGTK